MTIRIVQFSDEQDVQAFDTYVEQARKDKGTITGLYAGLMTSVMRDAKITNGFGFIELIRELVTRYKNLENIYKIVARVDYDGPNGTIERAEKLIAELEQGE